ncbi:MAG: putative nucleotidyltransferase component of viral defense system [Yoonia sp.]|jgi:predicted nucleotidyltransferase component of viral defense system
MSLQPQAVGPKLWQLLNRLMAEAELSDFYLVGGTALALHYGHRISVDIDLFTESAFDAVRLRERLTRRNQLVESTVEENTLTGLIDGIKCDCMAHQYSMVTGVQDYDGVRLIAVQDIAAMKLNAIANRRSKKDSWDLHELSRHFDREQVFSFYEKKYPRGSRWNVEKSLSYFLDADGEPDPICLKGLNWSQVKSEIAAWNRL